MPLPQDVGDIPVYAGDPLTIKCVFSNPDTTAIDVTTSTWEVKARGNFPFTVDVSQAAVGIILLKATKAATEAMLPTVAWDLYESPRWDRTMIKGRLVRDGDVTS